MLVQVPFAFLSLTHSLYLSTHIIFYTAAEVSLIDIIVSRLICLTFTWAYYQLDMISEKKSI